MISLRSINRGVILLLTVTFLPIASGCAESLPHPDQSLPNVNERLKIKKIIDDPTDAMATYALKDAVHPEIYKFLTFDAEDAKCQTTEILGFSSPDLVDKIAPEIKPGKYTYKDMEKYPGLKELFAPEFLRHIKPGGGPLIGSIPEFEIIPTRQLYWYLNLCKMTKQNLGKTKLDKDGYIVPASWAGGYPFPKPSGKFRAQQLYYNFEKRVGSFDTCFTTVTDSIAFNMNLNRDSHNQTNIYNMRFMGRTLFPPFGWFDEQAKRNGQFRSYLSVVRRPRSMSGTVVLNHKYDDPNKMDQWMIYVPSLRRIRKMNSTDTQDPSGDLAYDDIYHISQKITSKRYPYKFEIIEEREYLMPIAYNSAATWIDSKNGCALEGVQLMRRPCYVLQMTQLDPNYIYSKRVIYIDKETFLCSLSANYDQKLRLHRTQIRLRTFIQEIAQLILYGTQAFQIDHIDQHSTFQTQVHFPAPFERKDFTIQNLSKRGK